MHFRKSSVHGTCRNHSGYNITSSLIGWAHTQNDPCTCTRLFTLSLHKSSRNNRWESFVNTKGKYEQRVINPSHKAYTIISLFVCSSFSPSPRWHVLTTASSGLCMTAKHHNNTTAALPQNVWKIWKYQAAINIRCVRITFMLLLMVGRR